MLQSETIKNKRHASRALKALAMAAGVAVAAMASHASASQVLLEKSTMDTKYQANISGIGSVYSNGVNFTAQDWVADSSNAGGHVTGNVYTLYGFCVDIYHEITVNTTYSSAGSHHTTIPGYVYNSNESLSITDPLPTDFGGHNISTTDTPQTPGTESQLQELTNLIDTGWILHSLETSSNSADTEMRLAAIQAAIWAVEVPSKTVTVSSSGLNNTQFNTYKTYFSDYVSGNYTDLADGNDRFYTLVDAAAPTTQAFAIGWPLPGVPEPTTWAMMLTGFFGMGSVLRRQRKMRVAVAA